MIGQAARISISLIARIEIWLVLFVYGFKLRLVLVCSLWQTSFSCGGNSGLWNIFLGKFYGFLSSRQFSHRCLPFFLGQSISFGLQSDILSILPRRNFLLLCSFPLIATDVCTQTSKFGILSLDLHLIKVFLIISLLLLLVIRLGWTNIIIEWRRICFLTLLWSLLELSIIVTDWVNLCCQIRQVFIKEVIVIIVHKVVIWWAILTVCEPRSRFNWRLSRHLWLEIHLHLLNWLHLLSQLAYIATISIHCHHLLLLLKQKHLLLHHIHLHFDGFWVDTCLACWLIRRSFRSWCCIWDVHDSWSEVFLICELTE